MGMLRHCATEVICATLFGPKKVCCDHCESKWICCYHPKPNQLCCDRWNSGYVALSRIKSVMMRIMGTLQFCAIEVFLGEIARLKKGMLRPLKLKTEFSQICATEEFLCDLAWTKGDKLQFCATEKSMLQTFGKADKKTFLDIFRRFWQKTM